MKKPIIGITPQYDYERNRVWIGPNYLKSIRIAGGIPILLPLHIDKEDLEILTEHVDGFLFTGGPDIDPIRFGEETIDKCGVIIPDRDRMEEELFLITMKQKKPILGICRGIQIFNVFFGGTLYQDLKEQFKPTYSTSPDKVLCPPLYLSHYQPSDNHILSHSVYLNRNSLLYQIIGKEVIRVNSFHHQAIKDLSSNLKVSAVAADSLIEAVELADHPFFIAVQWHPEHLCESDENSYALFKAFVDACISKYK